MAPTRASVRKQKWDWRLIHCESTIRRVDSAKNIEVTTIEISGRGYTTLISKPPAFGGYDFLEKVKHVCPCEVGTFWSLGSQQFLWMIFEMKILKLHSKNLSHPK